MPGHSPGSVAYYVPAVEAVFVGDALATKNVLTGVPGPQPAPFTDDPRWRSSHCATSKASTPGCSPAGPPWSGGVAGQRHPGVAAAPGTGPPLPARPVRRRPPSVAARTSAAGDPARDRPAPGTWAAAAPSGGDTAATGVSSPTVGDHQPGDERVPARGVLTGTDGGVRRNTSPARRISTDRSPSVTDHLAAAASARMRPIGSRAAHRETVTPSSEDQLQAGPYHPDGTSIDIGTPSRLACSRMARAAFRWSPSSRA